MLRDVETEMHDRAIINLVFKKIRESLSPSYYDTVSNVTNRFVRWLNNGDKPRGFADVKGIPKRNRVRKLNPSDMVTREDGKGGIVFISPRMVNPFYLIHHPPS